jgi:hypothetical protein
MTGEEERNRCSPICRNVSRLSVRAPDGNANLGWPGRDLADEHQAAVTEVPRADASIATTVTSRSLA